MPLNSLAFLLAFLPVVAIGAHLLRDFKGARAAQAWILVFSLVFYARDGVRALPLLLGSILFNWAVSHAMSSPARLGLSRKRWLQVGLVGNVALLCLFKYTDIVMEAAAGTLGTRFTPPHWAFPLGISFFTLSQVMYLVDCYERLMPANSLFDHATFASFFPNVTAGPIVRAKKFTGQLPLIAGALQRDDRIARGLALVGIGLFKKAVLADSFSYVANAGYANVQRLSTTEAWLTSLAYSFEMYFDFSGYSDMAFGTALLLGIELVRNFNAPFRASTISDFWQRWHISLSTFITTYLYTPILRSMGRITLHTSALATLVAMTIAGIWHGASWSFLLFYMMHGVALAGYQYWKRRKRPLPRPLAAVLTFAYVNLAFVMFRSPDVRTALEMTRRLIPHSMPFDLATLTSSIAPPDLSLIVWPVLVGAIAAFVGPTSDEIAARCRPCLRDMSAVAALTLVSFTFLLSGAGNAFIYRAF